MPEATYTLNVLPDRLAVCRLGARDAVPAWVPHEPFVSITRTASELSIVCAARAVPAGIVAATGWRCLEVQGPLPFSTTGVIADLARVLARAGVSLLPVATYDTDYLLVTEESLATALDALTTAGHTLREAKRRDESGILPTGATDATATAEPDVENGT
jgi:hypothetical protein